jgi:hypothetical protein
MAESARARSWLYQTAADAEKPGFEARIAKALGDV